MGLSENRLPVNPLVDHYFPHLNDSTVEHNSFFSHIHIICLFNIGPKQVIVPIFLDQFYHSDLVNAPGLKAVLWQSVSHLHFTGLDSCNRPHIPMI